MIQWEPQKPGKWEQAKKKYLHYISSSQDILNSLYKYVVQSNEENHQVIGFFEDSFLELSQILRDESITRYIEKSKKRKELFADFSSGISQILILLKSKREIDTSNIALPIQATLKLSNDLVDFENKPLAHASSSPRIVPSVNRLAGDTTTDAPPPDVKKKKKRKGG